MEWWNEKHRASRLHAAVGEDQRNAFARDRDRILYSSAFRRLGGVTQIVRAGEADVFHTRLTHTLKVAQVGRRLAEKMLDDYPSESALVGIHPEVVEAACLAHDLGHPPFGHHGETVLNELVLSTDNVDGYEGNAQSLRILTKLALRFDDFAGLDLTRATLAASIKYPWSRDPAVDSRRKKWGFYRSEKDEFDFARNGWPTAKKTAEGELMDLADDIAYSVHDLEDFHRCRLIPWRQVFDEPGGRELIDEASKDWNGAPQDARARLEQAYARLKDTFSIFELDGYEALPEQRISIRTLTSSLIARYVGAVSVIIPSNENEGCIRVTSTAEDEIRILKQITRHYILDNPALAAQQKGHERVLRELFADLRDHSAEKYVPRKFLYLMRDLSIPRTRAVADCISSLTEAEAMQLHGRLRGYASGSVLDPIVR
ncbi:MAG: dNTP triphosphohydrolase [Candidatus Pacebacteria bacterium]|nr:dNTP triphosphohydrolase [Candidatus Paceibacterota bacterium]